MNLFSAYIIQRRKVILAFLFFSLIYAVSFFMYHLPLEAVAYPSMLCVLLGLGFILSDFFFVKRKHNRLLKIKSVIDSEILFMPETNSVEENDYQNIIQELQRQAAASEAAAAERYKNVIEYYTVWVHQIKMPITSMKLSLENEDTSFSKKLSLDLFRIEQYVDMVLVFLRLDSGSGDYIFKEYKLDDIIQQSIVKFSSEFIARKIYPKYTPTSDTVITDDKWLSFVIEQVLSNALKYTHKGEIKIYTEQPKILCIEDTGIGISPSDLPRIFEKGYTGYNGRIDKHASGIGLYLCKRICNNLGAKISITSELDIGTTVKIDLRQYKLKKE